MCEPTTLAAASFAISAGGAIANHQAQGKSKRANDAEAKRAYAVESRDISLRQQEEMKAASRQKSQGRRQAREAQSALAVSLGEAGVSGLTSDMLRGEIEGDEGAYLHTVGENEIVTIEQLQRMKAGASAGAQARINAVASPSILNTGLQIGAATIDLGDRLAIRKHNREVPRG